VLFVASEMAPLISTGGLADVVASLPQALRAQGHDVRVVLPAYATIGAEHRGKQIGLCTAMLGGTTYHGALREAREPGCDMPLYLIEHEGFFGREHPYGYGGGEYQDNPERFAFFCAALLDAMPMTNWRPDVVHLHDWQTGPFPGLLRQGKIQASYWAGVKTLFTIHNLAYQGRFGFSRFATTGIEPALEDGAYQQSGDINFMKGAILLADAISTVSPRYAMEIQTQDYGCGLETELQARRDRMSGILNGMDYGIWHPSTDKHIPAHYSVEDMTGKAACKAALQEELALAVRPDVPLIAMVSRLAWQKGIDLVANMLPELLREEVQVVVLGSGDPDLENQMIALAATFPERLRVSLRFDVKLSHLIEAGADFFLMPSRYEPCGLSQMYSMAYGTVPIVRHTGGLVDSVRGLNPVTRRRGNATGISFIPKTPQAVLRAAREALALYEDQNLFRQVRENGMQEDFTWDRSSSAYVAVYEGLLSP